MFRARSTTVFGKSRQFGDLDAIGPVGGAARDFVQKDDVAIPVGDAHAEIDEAGQALAQMGQFMKMRREKRPRAICLMEMLHRPPRRWKVRRK